jgi:hypothetical protein
MARASTLRQFIVARAGGSCEYCRLVEMATGVTFHIEHIVPRSRGGRTRPSNLALSCPGCNLAKNERTEVADAGGQPQSLFNPRAFEPWLLGWHLHFILDRESGMVLPRSAMAEVTIRALAMNDANRLYARKLQISVGLIG